MRLVAGGWLVAVLVAGLGCLAASAAAPSAGIGNFGACMNGQRSADVLMLIDESGSLRQSDPQATRVDAAQYLVRQWATLGEQSGVKIAVQTMGFSATTSDASGWLSTSTQLPQVQRSLEAFRTRDTGAQTDYWMALDGARRALAARARDGGSTCQSIVWFTDGQLDASARYANPRGKPVLKPYLRRPVSDARATAAAARDLCRPGGVADQIRSSDVALFGIGLSAGTAATRDFDLMRNITTGSGGCGAVPGTGLGDFRLASDIDGLFFAFDDLRTPGQLPIKQLLGVCQGTVCATQQHRFVLDDSITSVHILASASVAGLRLYLVPPKGSPLAVSTTKPGTARTHGAAVRSTVLSPRTTAVDLEADGSWAGQWSLVYVDPRRTTGTARSQTSMQLSSDIEPTVALPSTPIHAGEQSPPLTLGLARHGGAAVDPHKLLGTLAVDATFTDAAGHQVTVVRGVGAAHLSDPVRLDLDSATEGIGKLTVTSRLTTAAIRPAKGATIPGTMLTPSSVAFPVTVLSPVGFPTVQGRLNFGSATSAADLTSTLTVAGPGCVWVDGTRVTASPEGAGATTVSSTAGKAADCLAVGDGARASLPVRLTTQHAANGAVTGTVTVHLAPAGEPDRARTVPITFVADLNRPANETWKWATFVIALLVGIGVPVALMYAVKRSGSRIPPRALLGTTVDVTVAGEEVLRDGVRFALRPEDLRSPIPIPGKGTRRLEVGQVALTVHDGVSPFGTGVVHAVLPGASGSSSTRSVPAKDGAAELPIVVQNTWAVFHRAGEPADHGVLLLLVSGDASAEQRAALVDKAILELPGRLRSLGADRPGGAAPDAPSALADPDGGSGLGGLALADPDDPWSTGQDGPWSTGEDQAWPSDASVSTPAIAPAPAPSSKAPSSDSTDFDFSRLTFDEPDET